MMCKPVRLASLLGGLLAVTLAVAPAMAQDEKPADKESAEKKQAQDEKAAKEESAKEKKPAKEEKSADEKKDAKKEDAKKEDGKKESGKDKAKQMEKADKKKKAEGKAKGGAQTTALVTNLVSPTGIAIHEQTGDIFIASRYGVYRYDPKAHTTPNIEITGFPVDVYGKGPKYDISPLGVGFLNETTLIVGGGGREDGKEVVQVFEIGETPANPPLTEEDATMKLGPIKKGTKTALGEPATKGEGNFYDIAIGPSGVYISSNGDDTKGWILHIEVGEDGKLAKKLVPTIASKVDCGTDAPVPVEYSLDGKKLYVGQMGAVNLPGDSEFLIYDAASGELQKQFELDLHDPAGLAVSPKTKKIYVTDFAWAKPEEGGLYEIVINGDEVTTKKIVSLDKPTDIEFDKNGKLYVTVLGTLDKNAKTEDGEQLSPGKLLVIDAGL